MQRHNINEFGNVILTNVVRDLIQINNLQKQMQERKAMETQRKIAINNTIQPNRTTEETQRTLSNPPPLIESSLSRTEETPMENDQVRTKLPEENNSCHKNETVMQVDSEMVELAPDKKPLEQNSSTPSVPSNIIPVSNQTIPIPPQTGSDTSKICENPSASSETPLTGNIEIRQLKSEPDTVESETSLPLSKISKETTPCLETPQTTSQVHLQTSNTPNLKPKSELYRPFFDNSQPVSDTVSSSSDTSKPISEMFQSNSSSSPTCATPLQNIATTSSSRPISHGSTALLPQIKPSLTDQKEFDLFTTQFEQSNSEADNSATELKNLDSEISQIIDQLGNDLEKDGNLFPSTNHQPSHESQPAAHPPQLTQGNFQSPPVRHYSPAGQYAEMTHQSKYPAQISNQHYPQTGPYPTQMNQQSVRTGQYPTEIRQYQPQMGLNPSQYPHMTRYPPQMGTHTSQVAINSHQMGMNRSEIGQNPQHLPHMGQNPSQIGHHSYQVRPYLSQMEHSSQRTYSPELSYHSQKSRHPAQPTQHYSQISSQFPNISNHLRNGPQMGYVSSNMANALAQMGQTPAEQNQMSPQMRYLRMQLQMRHGASPSGSQLGQQGRMDGWPMQGRHWLPPAEHESSQRRYNPGPTQMNHELPQYRPPQLSHPTPHMGYGPSQVGQAPSYGQVPHHINQNHPQMHQGNSQYVHPQSGQQSLHYPQMQHYLNRAQPHFNRASPSQSPTHLEMHQRSLQQTPTPPSRSPLDSLPPHGRSGMFSPPTLDGFPSSEMGPCNGDLKKSNSPLTNCKSPDISGRYGERDSWRMHPFNFRTSNSPLSQYVPPPQINPQVRMPNQPMGIAPQHFGGMPEQIAMPPPQTSFLPKDHLAQRIRLSSGTFRPENPQLDNYHSPSDESIQSLLVDLPPIESPVVPLSVHIKSLGTLESIQPSSRESQKTSEVLSSVREKNVFGNNEISKKLEVQNGSECVEMKGGASSSIESKLNSCI